MCTRRSSKLVGNVCVSSFVDSAFCGSSAWLRLFVSRAVERHLHGENRTSNGAIPTSLVVRKTPGNNTEDTLPVIFDASRVASFRRRSVPRGTKLPFFFSEEPNFSSRTKSFREWTRPVYQAVRNFTRRNNLRIIASRPWRAEFPVVSCKR